MNEYAICKSCIMDTSDPLISFNPSGECSYCVNLKPFYQRLAKLSEADCYQTLEKMVDKIKKAAGQGAKYHCILGMSGGVDSSYTADLITTKLGLNPLIVHFNNGWNTEIAEKNIYKIVSKLKLEMLTEEINWAEFKDLQRAFLYSNVLDIELITDNALYGETLRLARKYRIGCIVTGDNLATESGMPISWRWEKIDGKNITSIHKQYGEKELKHFKVYTAWNFIFDKLFAQRKRFSPLNHIPYKKIKVIEYLKNTYTWQDYGGKHYESLFTRFYQAYILPTKFKIDKRRAHLSSLIRNGEITREDAISEIQKPIYDPQQFDDDLHQVLSKLDLTKEEFDQIMFTQARSHKAYASNINLLLALKKVSSMLNTVAIPFNHRN